MAEPTNILEWGYHWEKKLPDRVFMTQPMGGGDENLKTWTFTETMDEARRMASYLKSLEMPEKSQIGICSKNCSYWVMADLAIWMAGHVSVPVFPTLTAETFQYTLEHSESKLMFLGKIDPIWDEMKKGLPEDLPVVAFPLSPGNDFKKWEEIIAEHEPLEGEVERDPDETATIIYTSGSTGKPKGVMHSFKTMNDCATGIADLLEITPEDRYLSYLPIAHGMERWLGECVTLVGAEHLFYAESLSTFAEDLQRARPTLFLSVPRLWLKFQTKVFEKMPPEKLERLLKFPIVKGIVKKKILTALGLDQARIAGSGSAPMPKELIAWYRKLGLELLEGYGMTENFNYSHLTRPGDVKPGTVGVPYPGVECRIAEDGEIQVKGPGTMQGYFKNQEETDAVLTEDGFLCTGDRGSIDDHDRLSITGRTKELFKTSKGKYVAPAPIENKLVNHHRLDLCCVGGASYPQPHAVIQLSEEARAALKKNKDLKETISKELEEHLKEVNSTLEHHERLEFISVVSDVWMPDNGFLTPTMKIKRAKIEDEYSNVVKDWYEQKKAVIWQE